MVEGQGEVAALPCLCSNVRDHLEAWDWFVDPEPVRQPRSRLVDERVTSPKRPPRQDGISRALALVVARPADAVLIVCDADDDCPATWGPAAAKIAEQRLPGRATMIVREFETWLLFSILKEAKVEGRTIETIRDAKGALARLIGGYKPSLHQVELTRRIDIATLLTLSSSFRKLVRDLAFIFGKAGDGGLL